MARTIDQGKWIGGLDDSTPLDDAARAIVEARLDAVPGFLREVVDENGGADGAQIHRLRVATRRADAALTAFGGCFRKKPRTRVTRVLKRLRQAAAEARACDVQIDILHGRLAGLSADDAGGPADSLRFAIETLERGRPRAQRAVAECERRSPPRTITRLARKLIDRMKEGRLPSGERIDTTDGDAPTLGDVAAERLHEHVAAALAAGAEELDCFERLHALRIEVKRLRYAMELFACCLDETFRGERYPQVQEVQDRLGAVNDAHELADRLELLADDVESGDVKRRGRDRTEVAEGLRALAAEERARRDDLAARFRRWWPESGRAAIERAAPPVPASTIGVVPPLSVAS